MTYRVAIGVNIDASGAKAGAGETITAVKSIGSAAEGTATKLQRLIDASVGLHDTTSIGNARSWTGTLASEGLALDTLRAKYSPLYAVIQQYKAAQAEIRTAHALGALSSDEMASALSRQRQQALSTITAIRGLGVAQAQTAADQARLASLRSQYDPLYAAAEKYRQALADIAEAEQAGALAADRATAARLSAKASYQSAIAATTARETQGGRTAQDIVGRQTIVPDRSSDIAAYGASLDALRAKYSPLYAVIQQYKAAQAEIRDAHAVGALSADEMTAALSRERQQALSTIAAVKAGPTTRSAYSGVNAFQTANVAAQFQDVAVTAAMGMNPLQIALQQGTQLSSVLAMSERPVQSLLAGFSSLLSPVSLVTVGVVGLSAAAIQLFANWKSGTETADQALEKHGDLIKRIKDEYKSAGAGLSAILAPVNGVTGVYARENEAVLRVKYAEANRDFAHQFQDSSGIARTASFMNRNELSAPIDEYVASVRAGHPDIEKLRSELASIYETTKNDGIKKQAVELLKASESASELARSLPSAAAAIDAASRKAEEAARNYALWRDNIRGLVEAASIPLTPRQTIDQQYRTAVAGATGREQKDDAAYWRGQAQDRLREKLDLTRQSDELGTRAILARTAAERADIAAAQARIAGLQGHDDPDVIAQAEKSARAGVYAQEEASAAERLRQAQRSGANIGLTGLPAQIAAINASYADEIEKATGDAAAIEKLTRARAAEIQTAKASAMIDPLRQSSQSSVDLENQVALQTAGAGRSAGEVAALTEQMRLYAEYTRQGVEITPQLASAIDAAASRYGVAAGEMDKLTKAQQDGIQRMDGLRSATRSALGDLLKGDYASAAQSGLDWATGSILDNVTQSLLGRQGEAGGGSFGDIIGGMLGTGARGDSPSNPLYVTMSGAGSAAAIGGGLFALPSKGTGAGAGSMLDLIAQAEGTDKGRGYNETLAYGKLTGGPVHLTGMTLDQIDALQTSMLQDPANSWNSSAVGRYQITRSTLRDMRGQLGLSGSDVYDPALQDRIALQLLARRGEDVTGLRQEWTGLNGVDDASIRKALASNTASGSPVDLGRNLNTAWADRQVGQIDGVFSELTSGLGSIVNKFLPGLGSVLTSLLNGIGNAASSGGGGLFNWLGGLFGGSSNSDLLTIGTGGLYANGGVPGAAGLHRYVNQVVDKPTVFAFAKGGVMGEAGSEAIVPLMRDSAGRLGVYSGGAGATAQSVYSPSIAVNVQASGNRQTDAAMTKALATEMQTLVENSQVDFVSRQSRPGGMLNRRSFT